MKWYLTIECTCDGDEEIEDCLDVSITESGYHGSTISDDPIVYKKIGLTHEQTEALSAVWSLMDREPGTCWHAIEAIAEQAFLAGVRVGRRQEIPKPLFAK